jgi:hypothetical protein
VDLEKVKRWHTALRCIVASITSPESSLISHVIRYLSSMRMSYIILVDSVHYHV